MMLRQVSSRSQRGKWNLKLQSVLQISLLVAFCIWLLYQMEHSHHQKKSYPEIIKSKVDRSPFNIIRLSRRYGVGDGGAGDHGMDGVSPGKESDAFAEKDREEASHKAREMSFKGDDASSEVVHTVQGEGEEEEEEEEEHERGSHEARERSFKADDASSSVAHVPQSNELNLQPENGSENPIIAIHTSNATEGEREENSIVLSKKHVFDHQKNSTSGSAGTAVVQNKTAAGVAIGDGLNRTEALPGAMMKKDDGKIGRVVAIRECTVQLLCTEI